MSIKVVELTKEQWIDKIKGLSKDELVDLAIELDDKYEYEVKRVTKMMRQLVFAQRKLLEYGFDWKPKFRDSD